jgi:hypothetical protein
MRGPVAGLLALGLGVLLGCGALPAQPTLPARVQESLARTGVTVSAPQPGDVPVIGEREAMAAVEAEALESHWQAPFEGLVLARLESLGSLEGIDAADHPLVWIATSSDGRSEFQLVISGTDGTVIYAQSTTIEP